MSETIKKKITYKGYSISKPDNISLDCIKRYIDNVRYSCDPQVYIDFLSEEIKKAVNHTPDIKPKEGQNE